MSGSFWRLHRCVFAGLGFQGRSARDGPGAVEHRPGRRHEVLGRQAVLGEQVRGIPGALGECVGQAGPAQRAAKAGLGQGLRDGGAQAADDRVVLGRDDRPGCRGHAEYRRGVRGLITGTFTTTVTVPAARRTRAAASAGAIIMPLTRKATSEDGAVPETGASAPPHIPPPPALTPAPLLTPPPSWTASPAISAPP